MGREIWEVAVAYETILFDVANGAAKITLNRPDRLNSFTVQMHSEVADALSSRKRGLAGMSLGLDPAGR